MELILLERLKNEASFTCSNEELTWLIDHIGDEKSEIRDNLVFSALARSIAEGGLTKFQFDYLKTEIISRNYINYQLTKNLPETLYRSFSALINGFMIQADGDKTSPYFNLLSPEEKEYFFSASINYLKLEHDYTGYSPIYGWVHGIAHGADFLSKVVLHSEFSKERYAEILEVIEFIFKQVKEPFIDKEESRLAVIIYQLLLENKLDEADFIEWLKQADYPLIELVDYYKLNSFKNFLAAIYFKLENKNRLSENLKKELLVYLTEF